MAVTIQGSGQVIVQVKQTFLATTFSTTSTSLVNVTGASVSITPTSANNKILVIVNASGGTSTNTAAGVFALTRNGTSVGGGTAVGNRPSGIGSAATPYTSFISCATVTYLDSPATTSAVTYQLQVNVQSGYTVGVGYAPGEGDVAYYGRYPTIITVMEISGT
jgi:hypothetical protein